MEISLRYIYLKLESMLPFLFALIYLGGDVPAIIDKEINIKDRVSLLTGTCIAIFYIYKLVKEIGKKDEIAEMKKDIEEIKKKLNI